VLRIRQGEACVLFGDSDSEVVCEVAAVRDSCVVLKPIETRRSCTESPVGLTLAIATGKGKKLEEVVEQVTALGVRRVVPFVGERSIARRSNPRLQERLKAISVEACRQSGRTRPPEILPVAKNLEEALSTAGTSGARVLYLDEGGGREVTDVCSALDPQVPIVLFCGPEGGWSGKERNLLLDRECIPLSLGPRILRTELAGVVGVALVESLLSAHVFPEKADEE
jgi:16S rRNA (uracil1498-N3)-methyltransferase